VKPQRRVDICITCVSPNPPKLPLREELPSLGVELIYNDDFREPDERKSENSLVDNLLVKQLRDRKHHLEDNLGIPNAVSYQGNVEDRAVIQRRSFFSRPINRDVDDDLEIMNCLSDQMFNQPLDGSDHSIQSRVTEYSDTGNQIKELLTRNEKLLQTIVKFDFASFKELTTDDLTGIEPGSTEQVVRSKAFHRYYFDDDVGHRKEPVRVSMLTPYVRFLSGDVAVTSYIRLDTFIRDGEASTIRTSETRIWEKQNGKWVNCHYHPS
jgi:hypothetical protein